MRTKEEDKQALLKMQHEDIEYVNWFEESGAEIHRLADSYAVYEIPQFGGMPHSEQFFELGQEDEIIELAYSWT